MKVLLMGHPNVGKSVVFNRLTGVDVITSNYPGTTVEYSEGSIRVREPRRICSGTCKTPVEHSNRSMQNSEISMQEDVEDITVIDVPGTFSLEPKDRAEEVAVEMLDRERDAVVISVIDSSKIERGLYLTLEIIERGYPVVLALNMWDMARHKGIDIDVDRLSDILGIPVVATTATSGEGMASLVSSLKRAIPVEMGKIVERAGVAK